MNATNIFTPMVAQGVKSDIPQRSWGRSCFAGIVIQIVTINKGTVETVTKLQRKQMKERKNVLCVSSQTARTGSRRTWAFEILFRYRQSNNSRSPNQGKKGRTKMLTLEPNTTVNLALGISLLCSK